MLSKHFHPRCVTRREAHGHRLWRRGHRRAQTRALRQEMGRQEGMGDQEIRRAELSVTHKIHFRMMSLVHEDLYRLFRDPYKVLDAAGLAAGQTVLEVGCGPGFFTLPAARIVGEQGRVYALDINPLAVEKVRQKVAQEGVTNVETLLADAAQIDLPDQSFDLIYVFGLARPIGDAQGIVAELHRLLKPDGILAFEGRAWPSSELFRLEKRQGRIAQFRKV